MDNSSLRLTVFISVFVVLGLVALVYIVVIAIDFFEQKYRRSKFIKSYTRSFIGMKGDIAFKKAESLANKAGVTNLQAVKALDQLYAKIVERKEKDLSTEELEKIQRQFRTASRFDEIPENLRGHIDNLKNIVPENNVDLFKLEEEIQKISKTGKKYKYYSIFISLITIIGTAYTILGYYKNIG
jgi:hypothetical protein